MTGRLAARLLGLVLGLGALGILFQPLLGHDPREVVIANIAPLTDPLAAEGWEVLNATDLRFVVALTARNAANFLQRPLDVFDVGFCHPIPNALALGEPMLSFGLLSAPFLALSGEPVLSFNLLLVLLIVIAAGSIYALVSDWTGIPMAGVVAALLYAFHASRVGDVVHIYAWDLSWAALALWLSARLFSRPRWSLGLALGLCCAMQISGSFYPLLAAFFLALPFGVWLAIRHGLRPLGSGPGLLAVGIASAAALFVFWPYLSLRAEGVLSARDYQDYFAYSWLAPGERFFLGWMLPVLAIAGLVLGSRRALAVERGDPRWAVLIAALGLLYLAAGGTTGEILRSISRGESPSVPEMPNLYAALASFLPGLDLVRAPAALFSGTHLALCILAGFGAAAVLRAVPRRVAAPLAVVLALAVWVDTLRPAFLGFESGLHYHVVPLRPPPDTLRFFERLEEQGNRGPLLEVPTNPESFWARSESVLHAAYHGRVTSECYNSYEPPALQLLREAVARLPDRDALAELRGEGFTALVVHHAPGNPEAGRRRERFESLASQLGWRRLASTSAMTAYSIQEVDDEPSRS